MSKLFRYYGLRVPKGHYIFREGDEADSMYMIHQGMVKISKTIGNLEKRIQILNEGEFVGEMAIINSLPRSADAIALEDCELIKMDRESFDGTIKKNRQFAQSFISFLSERLRDTTEQLTRYYDSDHRQRIHCEILKEILRKGKKDSSGKWQLMEMDSFIENYNTTRAFDHTDVMPFIEELSRNGQITLKTDQKGKRWIAFKLY